jgi:stage V sporulation protein D (sporulation-specific penicillin-binding protein)
MAARRRKSDAARRANQVIRGRTVLMLVVFGVITFGLLFWRLYNLQIVQHEELQKQGVSQWTRSAVVSASRGTIYDRNSNVLAISATAETVCISPKDIQEFQDAQDEKIADNKLKPEEKRTREYIANGLARILELDASSILEKMEKTTWEYVELKKKTERAMADEVRRFMNGVIDDKGNVITMVNEEGEIVPTTKPTKLRGIFLIADSKRYYPYSTLAAQVIGFVNANGGAYGLEATYEGTLEGTAGYTVTAKNNNGEELLYQYEQYYDAENGGNLVLTLDSNIQYYLEEGLESMINKFNAANGAAGIVMDVNSGAILAMASLPTYDLNNYSMVYDTGLAATLDGLKEGSDAYLKALGNAQLKQWRSKCFNDTYEPGSAFKPITLAAALEEGKISKNSTFNCTGSVKIDKWTMHCSKKAGHGLQTLEVAVGNSCNPAFINIGLEVGPETYYQYLKDFGLMDHTGVELNGEASSIYHDE